MEMDHRLFVIFGPYIFRKITWYFGSFNIWTLVSFLTPLMGDSFLAKDAPLPKRSIFRRKKKVKI